MSLFSGAKLVSIGVTAIAAAATILTCGAAAPIMVAVATATAVAGTATVVNGMAEIGEGLTASSDTSNDGTNFVRDWIMGGNADAYEKQKRIFSTAAQRAAMSVSLRERKSRRRTEALQLKISKRATVFLRQTRKPERLHIKKLYEYL